MRKRIILLGPPGSGKGTVAAQERIIGRRSCPRCGRVYRVSRIPPRVSGVCDDCGVALVQRKDDTESVMRKRFAVYNQETAPLQSYYQKQQKLVTVDGAVSASERFAATLAAIR